MAEDLDALGLDLLELAEQIGDARESLDGVGLERRFHLREAEGVVLFLLLFAATRLAFAILVLVVGAGAFLLFLFLVLLVGRAGGFLGNLAAVVVLAFLHLVDRRLLGEHRVEIEDLAQLHLARS